MPDMDHGKLAIRKLIYKLGSRSMQGWEARTLKARISQMSIAKILMSQQASKVKTNEVVR